MIDIKKLQELPLFKNISTEALTRLAEDMKEVVFEKNESILKEGEKTGSLFIIQSGVVSVYKNLDHKGERRKTVAKLESGEFFGEMAFLENQSHSASIEAQSKATLLVLPRTALDALLLKDPGLALKQVLVLLAGVSSRLRSTTNELVTVFEVARGVSQFTDLKALVSHVLAQIQLVLGEDCTTAFYRWNEFNEEYDRVQAGGPNQDKLPANFEPQNSIFEKIDEGGISIGDVANQKVSIVPFKFSEGDFVLFKSDMPQINQGFFVFHKLVPNIFNSGERQLMDTVASVLAPAISAFKNREEEAARVRLAQSKQGYSND